MFGVKEVRKSGFIVHNVIRVSSTRPDQNLEKTNDPIPKKHPDRGKDGQTLFCGTRGATAAGKIHYK